MMFLTNNKNLPKYKAKTLKGDLIKRIWEILFKFF